MVAEGVERQHAEDWLAVRRAKNLPLTRTAWADTRAEASKAGLTLADAIGIAAAHGWAGFRASWQRDDTPRVNGGHPPRKSDALMASNIAAAQRFIDGDTHGH